MNRAVFITGTDTGVGKTVVTAALCRCLLRQGIDTGVMKPIETGVASSSSMFSDAVRLKTTAGTHDSLALIRPYRFRAPIAPLMASRLARTPIDLQRITAAFRRLHALHSVLLVEGVGGVQVPLTPSQDVLDLITRLKVPVVVVGRVSLGGINHARLTIDALARRQVPVMALMLNRPAGTRDAHTARQEHSTVTLLQERLGVPVLGPLPYASGLPRRWDHAVLAWAKTAAIKQLAALILSSGR